MRTDTRELQVIDVDPVCAWCHIRLAAVPDEPILFADGTYHPSCARAVRKLWKRFSATHSPR